MSTPDNDNVYHKHLDECPRCREQPFNMCPEGDAKLREQAFGSKNNALEGLDDIHSRFKQR